MNGAAGVDAHARDSQGLTALMRAVLEWDLEAVKALIPLGGVDIQGPGGDTALIMAARLQADDIARELIGRCDPDIQDACGATALMCAILEARPGSDVVERLCAVSDVNLKGARGESAAMMALKIPKVGLGARIFEWMADRADLDQVDAEGRSLERAAASNGHCRAVSILGSLREREALGARAPDPSKRSKGPKL